MDAVIYVEVRGADGVLVSRQPLGAGVRMGRAPDNDIVLHDEFVEAHHLAALPDGDGVLVRDLGTTNGTDLDGIVLKASEATIPSGRSVMVGRSRVTFAVVGGAVAEAKTLPSEPTRALPYARLPAWTTAIAVTAYVMVSTYLTTYTELTVGPVVGVGIGVMLGLMMWAGIWALGGRVFTGRARFREHLGFIGLFVLISMPVNTALGWVTFAADSRVFDFLVDWVVTSFLFIGLIWFGHIDIASARSRRFKATVAGGLTLALIALVSLVSFVDTPPSLEVQGSLSTIPAVPAGLTRSGSLDDYLEGLREIESDLDAD